MPRHALFFLSPWGEDRGEGDSILTHPGFQAREHSFHIAQNIIVPVSNHMIAKGLKRFGSGVILVFLRCMLAAIKFNNQFFVMADEINNKPGHGGLPSEFQTGKLPALNVTPEQPFRLCLVTS